MNILLIGNGGREHALSKMITSSPLCDKLFIAPGNAGTAQCGQNVTVDTGNFDMIRQFVIENQVGFVVVGPEDPIVNGIADYFHSEPSLKDVFILAPSAAGARLEGSKNFAKEFMSRHHIPTAKYRTFDSSEFDETIQYLEKSNYPVVVKADGLAAGKGVVICKNNKEAVEAIEELFIKNKFGKAGSKVVIEEFLDGIELSVFLLTDGHHYILLPSAKDYKRAGEGDTGLNTGGMGCISPPPFVNDSFMEKVEERIIIPTVEGLAKENISYKGFLFFGLMNVKGDPHVIEYNVRLGDPETEVILPRLDQDILPFMIDASKGKLENTKIRIKEEYAATVMLVSGGYPGEYEKGEIITGLPTNTGSIIYFAGTSLKDDHFITSGGRVLCITSLDKDLKNALDKSYTLAASIHFNGKYYRKDIGQDLLKFI